MGGLASDSSGMCESVVTCDSPFRADLAAVTKASEAEEEERMRSEVGVYRQRGAMSDQQRRLRRVTT